jgi:hypothetical protein
VLWLLLVGCSPCLSPDDVPIEAADAATEAEVRQALRDFDAWTGFSGCLSRVEPGERGAVGRVLRAESRADVFYGRCQQLDRQADIAATAPQVFIGTGIDPTAYRTEAQRRSEDFARACARAADQSPWLPVAASSCWAADSERALRGEDAFLVDLLGGPETGLPRRAGFDEVLGSIPGDRAFQLAPMDDLLVAVDYARVYTDEGPHADWRIVAHSLPDLDERWRLDLPRVRVGEAELKLFAGLDGSLIVNERSDGVFGDAAWLADADGVVDVAPAVLPEGIRRWESGATDGAGWVLLGASEDGAAAVTYDPITGLGPVEPGPDGVVVRSHPDGVVYVGPDRVWQPATGLDVVPPAWSRRVPRLSGWRLRVAVTEHGAAQWLSRSLDPTALWTLDAQSCEGDGRLYADGVAYDYRWDPVYAEDAVEIWRLP